MAQMPCYVIPGQPQHVIQRGNNRPPIFGSEGDFRYYLEKLKDASQKHECDIHAYVLMTNHVHLLSVIIPADVTQRITNTGKTDLVFLSICTPRFEKECYKTME